MGSNKREKIKMTDPEVAAFLAASFKVQVATIGKGGEPHLVTMFYTLLDGKIAFTTYRSSQKVLNLRRDPTMTCLVEDGTEYNELRGVSLYGKGRIIEDPDVRLKVGAVVGSRMAGLPVPELGAPIDPAFAAGLEPALAKRVVIVMEPERTTSWDHHKA
ncbi:PPOX class F420-dependent oxidoreductase [Actinomadura viridis]|uniref:Nitroimidazol reductase NimA-like FMN-containing flavoprotein (Pyridoxamine 5'-phosphate oxidase superfamily) n=1 Tax=Actinomadura viridis TaxID=58110 RepID=A0A931DE47_9ACTN|nr:pyridoxamine 5'-phosphate oxidase family protein [Actinomadura viridis]MBG6087159.1 nitroimidazol reductase NimA-like FMN-containing flavoprotein (pyridoxamine 5'-phosphate oxidase superfamily) [Actinomadura viridis]